MKNDEEYEADVDTDGRSLNATTKVSFLIPPHSFPSLAPMPVINGTTENETDEKVATKTKNMSINREMRRRREEDLFKYFATRNGDRDLPLFIPADDMEWALEEMEKFQIKGALKIGESESVDDVADFLGGAVPVARENAPKNGPPSTAPEGTAEDRTFSPLSFLQLFTHPFKKKRDCLSEHEVTHTSTPSVPIQSNPLIDGKKRVGMEIDAAVPVSSANSPTYDRLIALGVISSTPMVHIKPPTAYLDNSSLQSATEFPFRTVPPPECLPATSRADKEKKYRKAMKIKRERSWCSEGMVIRNHHLKSVLVAESK